MDTERFPQSVFGFQENVMLVSGDTRVGKVGAPGPLLLCVTRSAYSAGFRKAAVQLRATLVMLEDQDSDLGFKLTFPGAGPQIGGWVSLCRVHSHRLTRFL